MGNEWGDRTPYPLLKSPKAVLHWALVVGEEAIAANSLVVS
ncbi:hypothetical protein [Nostoc sp. TCL240-02]|nr:hypothetical protein [Nostoc sp. TCL240-02]